jgi:hypothetical protein
MRLSLHSQAVMAGACGESGAVRTLAQAAALARELGLPAEPWPLVAALAGWHGFLGEVAEAHRATAEAVRLGAGECA